MGTNMSEDHPLKGLQISSSLPESGDSTPGSCQEAGTPVSTHRQGTALRAVQHISSSNECDSSNLLSKNEQNLKINFVKNGSKNVNCDEFKLYNKFEKEAQREVVTSCEVAGDDVKVQSQLELDDGLQFNISHGLIGSSVEKSDTDLVSDFEDNKPDVVSADSEDSALGSLPCEPPVLPEGEDEPQDRSDGSDSGLGSEMAEDRVARQPFAGMPPAGVKDADEIITVDGSNFENFEIINNNSESTNRKLDDPLSIKQFSDIATFAGNNISTINCERKIVRFKSNLKRKREIDDCDVPKLKKKRSLTFGDVTVYYFSRSQGFTCIPSQGGSTLGMANQHTHSQQFTLPEHTLEQRRLHRQILQQLRSERHSVQGSSVSSSDYSDSEDEPSEISESELDLDSYYFLQPVPTRQRRALLRAAGVRKIEAMEKDECRDIRTSRELCGCSCKGYCDPETCSCSQNGIKCQVDRLNFPCGCTRDGCGNTTGRIEFNPVRVRTHFIHTLMRIGLEKKAEENLSKAEASNEQMQWSDSSARLSASALPYIPAVGANCISPGINKYNGNLLRDVNLTSHVEVESCVNAGTFSNLHYDVNNTTKTAPGCIGREDSLDLYTFREECYNEESRTGMSQERLSATSAIAQNHQIETYSSNISKAKVVNFSNAGHVAYPGTAPSLARFPCEMNFPYPPHPDPSHYPNNQQYSAASFEDFSQQSHGVFNHYNSVYMNEYVGKPAASQDQSANNAEYQSVASSAYSVYRAAETACFGNGSLNENKETNQYTNLHSPAYPLSNKLESFSELMHGRYSYGSYDSTAQPMGPGAEQVAALEGPAQDPAPAAAQQPPANPPPPESDENFGEIIKKTMVESVSTL